MSAALVRAAVAVRPYVMLKRLWVPCVDRESALARLRWLACVVLPGWMAVGAAVAATDPTLPVVTDEQVVELRAGWNAVSLRIDPLVAEPVAQFGALPIDKVATYFPSRTPVEFIQDPGAQPWKQKGWAIWYAPGLPEGPLSNLHALPGSQSYLVHATAAATWKVRGTVVHRRTRWHADSFNFVGFPVDPANPPTFGAWFAGSKAHQSPSTRRSVVYTLGDDDRWQPVTRPEATSIRAGAAYWVYCDGASDFQGPLEVVVGSGGTVESQVRFGPNLEKIGIHLVNAGPFPASVTTELLPPTGLPLFDERRDATAGTRTRVPLGAAVSLGTMESAARRDLRLVIDRSAMTGSAGAALLVVRSDSGVLVRLPVTAESP